MTQPLYRYTDEQGRVITVYPPAYAHGAVEPLFDEMEEATPDPLSP